MKRRLDTLCLLALTLGLAPGAFAQMSTESQMLNNRAINIEGQVSGNGTRNSVVEANEQEEVLMDQELEFINSELKKQHREIKLNKQKSKGFQKLQRSTEKLADVTEEYIEEKNYAQNKIDRYNKKIDCLLNDASAEGCDEFIRGRRNHGEVANQDEVAVNQAAREKEVVVEAPQVEESVAVEDDTQELTGQLRLIPSIGAKSFNSDGLSLETQFSGGVRIESAINERVHIGVGIASVKMDSQLISSDQSGFYSNGRELEYNNIALDFYGRYNLSSGRRLTPYLGMGISYNRSMLEYKNNNNAALVGGTLYSDESYVNHYVSGNIALGADIAITKTVGVNLQLDYSRGLGSSLTNDSAVNPGVNADQQKLINISNEIADANTLSAAMGLIVIF